MIPGGAWVTREGAPLLAVAGGGLRSSGPSRSTAEVSLGRGGRAAGRTGLWVRAVERGRGRGRRWKDTGRRAPFPFGGVRSREVAPGGGGGPPAGRLGLAPDPERTEV